MFSQTAIDVVGWIYFLAWSLSFYGQLILNYKLKRYIIDPCSVEGMNLDYLAMNVTGFTFYSFYCSYGYFFAEGRKSTGTVDLNDLLFAYHAIIVTLLTAVQAFIYPRGRNRIMKKTVAYLVFMWAFCIFYGALSLVRNELKQGFGIIQPPPRWNLLSIMGYFKLSISFLKYLPQMYWNWKRKSTHGWSICNILLDFTGGLFSFLQMGMESSNGKNLNINPVKLILSMICMVYDVVFIVQHYVLYPHSARKAELEGEGDVVDPGTARQTERAKLSGHLPALPPSDLIEPHA